MIAKRMKSGGTIGIIAPSNYLDEMRKEQLFRAEEFFKKKGFHIKRGQYIFEEWYGSAGTPEMRANDLQEMFLDDEVDMIICIEGGATCNTILPYLDFELIKMHPKIITGYSDITVLLQAIYQKTGLVTFHSAEFYEYGDFAFQEKLWNTFEQSFMECRETILLGNDYRIVRGGNSVIGVSNGTNLGCMMNLFGTPMMSHFDNNLLFLEAYQISESECARRFSQMKQASVFKNIKGIVIGYIDAFQKENYQDTTFETILLETVKEYQFPIIKCNLFGHQIANEMIPIGVSTRLNIETGKIEFLEPYLK